MTPEQYVQQKAAASGSSFYYAFLFLPKPRRAAITAFYAAMRGKVARELMVEGVVEGRETIAAALRSRFVALADGVTVGSVVLNTGDIFDLRSMALYETQDGLFKRIQATSLERTISHKGEH